MRDQTVVITGANSGIGAASAQALAACGAEVVMLCRNLTHGHRIANRIRSTHSGAQVSVYFCDLTRFESIHTTAAQVLAQHQRINILVNNAGVYLPRRQTTEDQLEATLQTNHLGPFLLTQLLIPRLLQNTPARILNVSSEAHRSGRLCWEDLQSEDVYRGFEIYSTTKLMNILHVRSLAQRLQPTLISANALHPGVVATGFAQDEPSFFGTCARWLSPFFRTPLQGAKTLVYLCTQDAGIQTSGDYFIDNQPRKPSTTALDTDHAERLWEISERLTGAPSWA